MGDVSFRKLFRGLQEDKPSTHIPSIKKRDVDINMLITIVGNEGLCSLDSQYTKTCKLLPDSSSCDVDSHSHSGGNFTHPTYLSTSKSGETLCLFGCLRCLARPDAEADSRSKFSAGFPSLPVVPSLGCRFGWREG